MSESTDLSSVAKYGAVIQVTEDQLSAAVAFQAAYALSMLPDDALTAEQLATRVECRRRNAEIAAAEHAEKVALHAEMDALATSLGGVAEAMIRHHLPPLPTKQETLYYDWPCPGCDGGPDDGGYFPCSTIDAVREAL